MKTHHCQTEEDTNALARALAGELRGLVTLSGPLGAGKSTFARALIKTATHEDQEVPSPTFTLVQEYAAKRRHIYHLDLYRLEEPEEIYELGWDDMIEGDNLILIEWVERIENLLPTARTDITININDDKSRSFKIETYKT